MPSSSVLAPGTILQHMYLRERLASICPAKSTSGRFVEVGVGLGHISQLLLSLGWRGVGYDLSEESVRSTSVSLAAEIADGRYAVREGNWLDADDREPVDLVISCMVLEHLDEDDEERYLGRCADVLTPDGLVLLLVPGSPAHWGIEDEIAGHRRRYTAEGLAGRLDALGWQVTHSAGLTYPLSNVLLPFSDWLVRRAEGTKQELSMLDRTKMAGTRRVAMKTSFPPIARWLLNEHVMHPAHLLQKRNRDNPKSLILYAEARRKESR